MGGTILKRSLIFFFVTLALACVNRQVSGKEGKGPVIHVENITHTFSPVFEGEELSHAFTIVNRGASDLEIKKVTHS